MRISLRLTGLLSLALLALPPVLRAQGTAVSQPVRMHPLLTGTAWYPEQWKPAQWDADLALMEAAHIHLVRVGEYAWSTLEPAEGTYDFDWLALAIRKAESHHIAVLMSTPSSGPPAWLTNKYPEVLRVDATGRRYAHGHRQHFSFASVKYRELCRDMTERLAKRFGHDPNVIGWQLGNEFLQPSFDPDARAGFQKWLAERYGSLAALNEHWTTAYWSQAYDSFAELQPPGDRANPGLVLDWDRYITATWVSFAQNQIDVLRPNIAARQFITTNTLGWFDGFDEYALHRVLDMAGWDDYVSDDHANGDHFQPIDNAARHDLTRGYKRQNFWVLETPPVFADGRRVNNPLEMGQGREMAWQAVGHGADAVLWWQWRSALNGQETYHGTIVAADGSPRPFYPELQQIGAEFERTGGALAGTSPHAEVAVIQSYESRWAMDIQHGDGDFDPVVELVDFYRPLETFAQSVDFVSASADLSQYKLVVAPCLNVISPALAQHLLEYVRNGGHLLLGPRSGMKDDFNALNVQGQPGALVPALGGKVEEYYNLLNPIPVAGLAGTGMTRIWAEAMRANDPATEVLLRYGKGVSWLENQPAALRRRIGKGELTYVGAYLDAKLLDTMEVAMQRAVGVEPILADAPAGVEVCRRSSGERTVLIVINHNSTPVLVKLKKPLKNLLAETAGRVDSIDMKAFDVAVIE